MPYPLLTTYVDKATSYPFHSFKYLEDNTLIEDVLFDTPQILLVKRCPVNDGPVEILWACHHLEDLLQALKPYAQCVIKFVPKDWYQLLRDHGFQTYGILRDYWLKHLSFEDAYEYNVEFANINDVLAISDLTKENRYASREFLGEEPEFVRRWLTIDEQGMNDFANKDAAIIVQKHKHMLIGVIFVGIYGHTNPVGPTLWIREIAVKKEYQGQGYGRKLLAQALAYGTRKGATRSFLMADDLNKYAIQLYQSFGFEANHDDEQIDMMVDYKGGTHER